MKAAGSYMLGTTLLPLFTAPPRGSPFMVNIIAAPASANGCTLSAHTKKLAAGEAGTLTVLVKDKFGNVPKYDFRRKQETFTVLAQRSSSAGRALQASDLPCNVRREEGQSLVIGGPSLVILEGKACNPL